MQGEIGRTAATTGPRDTRRAVALAVSCRAGGIGAAAAIYAPRLTTMPCHTYGPMHATVALISSGLYIVRAAGRRQLAHA